MKFKLTKASDWWWEDEIEINTLEELLELYKIYGNLVIETSFENDNIYEIEIYDDYREW
jgi:predicted GNAT family N-acyltransferase